MTQESFTKALGISLLILILASLPVMYSTKVEATSPTISLFEYCITKLSKQGIALSRNCTKENDPITDGNSVAIKQFELVKTNGAFKFGSSKEEIATFKCSASFPVTWIYRQDEWVYRSDRKSGVLAAASKPLMISYKRDHVNSSDLTSSPQYFAFVEVSKKEHHIGEYVCQSISESEIGTSSQTFSKLAVFEDSAGVFPLSGENVPIWQNEHEDGTVILPCYVNNPTSTVALTKLSEDGLWEPVSTEGVLSFRPELGFIYVKTSASGKLTSGTYNCSSAGDSMKVTLQPGEKSIPAAIDQVIVSPASFKMSVIGTNLTVRCCSNSQTPPMLKLSLCGNKQFCESQLKYTTSLDNLKSYSSPKANGSCQESPPIPMRNLRPLNAFCVGDGISVNQPILSQSGTDFSALRKTNANRHPYTSWKEIDPLKLIDIFDPSKPAEYDSDGKLILYKGLKVWFYCVAPPWYFARGRWMTVNFSNGTSIRLEDLLTWHNHHVAGWWMWSRGESVFEPKIVKEVESISCMVPEIYSGRMINKTVDIRLEDGVAPQIVDGNKIEKVTWKLNDADKTLTCKFSGRPEPSLRSWLKGKNPIYSPRRDETPKYKITSTANTSTLNLKVVTAESAGEYTFYVKNDFGNATKIFHVEVTP